MCIDVPYCGLDVRGGLRPWILDDDQLRQSINQSIKINQSSNQLVNHWGLSNAVKFTPTAAVSELSGNSHVLLAAQQSVLPTLRIADIGSKVYVVARGDPALFFFYIVSLICQN